MVRSMKIKKDKNIVVMCPLHVSFIKFKCFLKICYLLSSHHKYNICYHKLQRSYRFSSDNARSLEITK